jgi:23S rRNA (guanosine2251-2'-O)-methyltransferase
MRLTLGIHPVREALRAHRALDKILVAKGAGGPRIQEIIDLCRDQSVPVRFESREALDRASKSAAHQGVIAFGAAHDYVALDAILEGAQMLVVLDGVEDPHNLGAIIRTAHAAGANGIVVAERRAAPITETVARAAAGALEYLPVARVTNISQTLDRLKHIGLWIYGLDERGTDVYDRVEFTRPSAIVLGGEGKGLHQGVRKQCDFLVRIPMSGQVSSLNVSVAAGIILFEWRRRTANSLASSLVSPHTPKPDDLNQRLAELNPRPLKP